MRVQGQWYLSVERWVVILCLFQLPVAAVGQEADDLYTEIVALEVHIWNDFFDQRREEFNHHIDDEGRRYLPLTSMLRFIGAKRRPDEPVPGMTTYLLNDNYGVVVDPKNARIRIRDSDQWHPIIWGYSDIADAEDAYVSMEQFQSIFGFAVEWDDYDYLYNVLIERDTYYYIAFEQKLISSAPSFTNSVFDVELPETEPPFTPYGQAFSLDVADYNLVLESRGDSDLVETTLYPTLALSGQLLGGLFDVELSHPVTQDSEQAFSSAELLDTVSWQKFTNQHSLWFGDTRIGVDSLVYPSSRSFGFAATGVFNLNYGGDINNVGRQYDYYQREDFTGQVPLGSQVRLLMNNSVVEEVTVNQESKDQPGYGEYSFRQVLIPATRLVEVKIQTITPDGQRDEQVQRFDSGQLGLPAGLVRYSLSLGTRRIRELDNQIGFRGQALTSALDYGVFSWLTLGADMAVSRDPVSSGDIIDYRGGLSGRLQLMPGLSLSLKGAAKTKSDNQPVRWAREAELAFRAGTTRTRVNYFSYDPGYLSTDYGRSDKWGGWLNSRVRLWGSWLELSGAHIRRHSNEDSVSYLAFRPLNFRAGERLPVIVRSSVGFSSVPSAKSEAPFRWISSTYLTTLLARRYQVTVNQSFGEAIYNATTSNMHQGLPVPLLDTLQEPSVQVLASARLFQNNNLDLTYRKVHSSTSQWLGAGYRYSSRRLYWPSVSLRHDREITSQLALSQAFVSVPLRTNNRLMLNANLAHQQVTEDEFIWQAGLQISWAGQLVNYPNRGVSHNPRRNMNRGRGGVTGLVYLDKNANGFHDYGEPGIGDIRVKISEGGKVVSDDNGGFVASGRPGQTMTFQLDAETLPAGYTPTQGVHRTLVKPGLLSNIRLGVTILPALTGQILLQEQEQKPLVGGIVDLISPAGEKIATSITDSEGYYYFDSVDPGDYTLRVDPQSIPAKYDNRRAQMAAHVEIQDEWIEDEWGEIEMAEMVLPSTAQR